MKPYCLNFCLSFIIVSFFLSCQKPNEDIVEPIKNLPSVTTVPASQITFISFASGGTVADDGGDSVVSRGVVWSSSPNPTINLPTKQAIGAGLGNFTGTIDNLSTGTLYYYRAYAVNSVGVAYGNELTVTTLSPTIYIAGTGNPPTGPVGSATLWTNNSPTFLPYSLGSYSYSYARCVFAIGSDVYVGGNISPDGFNFLATIWKNGLPTYPQEVGSKSAVTSVFVSGNDVYAVGYGNVINQNGFTVQVAKFWKNGVLVDIGVGTIFSSFSKIILNGGDIYLCGYRFLPQSGYAVATVWKNGMPESLSNGVNNTYASDIVVKGADVFVAGYEQIGNINYPRFWKNSVLVDFEFSNVSGTMGAICIYNDSLYVAGNSNNGTKDVATVWKNGKAIFLQVSNPNNNSYARDIKVLGADMFITGVENSTGPRFWKNTTGVTLSSSNPTGQGNSILVK